MSGCITQFLQGEQWLSGRVLDSSHTGVTVLWSLSKTHCTGSTQEDLTPCLTERLLMGRKESNQTKHSFYYICICDKHQNLTSWPKPIFTEDMLSDPRGVTRGMCRGQKYFNIVLVLQDE